MCKRLGPVRVSCSRYSLLFKSKNELNFPEARVLNPTRVCLLCEVCDNGALETPDHNPIQKTRQSN